MEVTSRIDSPDLRFIDLFAGLGGFHLALSRLGCKCVFASEIKEDLIEQYKSNFPDVRIVGDVTRLVHLRYLHTKYYVLVSLVSPLVKRESGKGLMTRRIVGIFSILYMILSKSINPNTSF